MKPTSSAAADRVRRPGTTLAAFLIGLPLAAGFLYAVHAGPLRRPDLQRYLAHPVEWVEVGLFACAIGGLGAKLMRTALERLVFRAELLPHWDGKPVGVDAAPGLLAHLARSARRFRRTYLYQRVLAVLDFLHQRRSAEDLDDQLRALADSDAITLDASYALTRFITWAIPILGFLGTVLGITEAISGIKSDELQLGSITGGLATAFDATALGLALTMVTMFCSFLVERTETGVLEAVDDYVEQALAHRFQRASAPVAAAPTPATVVVTEAMQRLMKEQAEALTRAVAELQRRALEALAPQQEKFAAALDAALERTQQAHLQRLAAVERGTVERAARLFEQFGLVAQTVQAMGQEQTAGLKRLADLVAAQAGTLAQLQVGEKQLVHLQTVLNQNLASLAGSGAFERAVHSLTAAMHLFTARVGANVPALLPPPAEAPAVLPMPSAPTPDARKVA